MVGRLRCRPCLSRGHLAFRPRHEAAWQHIWLLTTWEASHSTGLQSGCVWLLTGTNIRFCLDRMICIQNLIEAEEAVGRTWGLSRSQEVGALFLGAPLST